YCRSEHCRICNPAICQAFQEQIATGLTTEHIHPVGIGWHHILPLTSFSFFKRKFREAISPQAIANCLVFRAAIQLPLNGAIFYLIDLFDWLISAINRLFPSYI
ncbi:MAG: hypothetical protein LBL04_16525, partial [Bacteroidales bacterium]|nr:hypothetical protein [Bacteroidales bacterium]